MPGLERLRLLASAIAARPVEVADAGPDEPAWTDGATIHVDAAGDPRSQLQELAVQASLLAAGSLDREVLDRLGRRRAVTRRYLGVEGHRALAENEAYLPPAVRSMIDPEVAARVEDAEASLRLAAGRQPIAEPPPAFGVIRPRRVSTTDEGGEPSTGAGEASPAAPPLGTALPELADGDEEDEDEAAGDLGDLVASPVGGGGAIGRWLRRLLSNTRSRRGGGPPGADAPTHLGRARARGRGGYVTSVTVAPVSETEVLADLGGRTYPEWNVHRRRYRPDWCTVIESDPPAADRAPMPAPDGSTLRRPLSRLGVGLVRCRRRPEGDEIDLDAVIESQVAVLAGAAPEDDLYIESLRRRRDLSVLVLLDVSGSAGEPGPSGRPVHEQQRLAASTLTTALHELGDRVGLFAFNSQGRRAVHVYRVKGFDDPLDRRVVDRLGGLVPGAYTRLGAAIRHGATVVRDQGGTPRRLLVVISDGFAYDHGYEGRYGEADARRALLEARRSGVGCLCLSVGAGVDAAALRRVFGTAAHAAVPSVDQLPPLVGPLFRAALRSSEAQRRVYQRRERTRERLEIERKAS